jgi:nicotinic acid mononucleotide adenylyltransferase
VYNDDSRDELLKSLVNNEWFRSALEDYSLRDLIDAGLQPPLPPAIEASREEPITSGHTYVNFAAHPGFSEIKATAQGRNAVVLVAMGSYAPMHHGHVDLMEAADQAARDNGHVPVAAVFCLHSEARVRAKIHPLHPQAPILTDTRVVQARQVLPHHLISGTPTFLDTWDATMPGGPRSFTDNMIRIVRTLEQLEVRWVTPIAVFGSDNAVSMRAFARYGYAICINRPRHEDPVKRIAAEPQMASALRSSRVVIADRDPDALDISSTDIRNSGA